MDNDELKTLWARRNRELEASMRLNTALLQQWNLRAVDTSLKRLARGLAFELVFNLGAIVLIGAFMAAHVREPQFLIPAIALDIYAIALVVAAGRPLAEIGVLDCGEPVVTIQKRLEALRVRRIRSKADSIEAVNASDGIEGERRRKIVVGSMHVRFDDARTTAR